VIILLGTMRIGLLNGGIRLLAPAKVNIFLEIIGGRGDGYHEIETVIMAVDRCDDLTARRRDDNRIDCRMRWGYGLEARRSSCFEPLPEGAANLAERALRLLRDRGKVRCGIAARFVKRIPASAGLGGASSDAAAALIAGNYVWKLDWPVEQLAELAAELGSDVPFFVRRCSLAICRGRGEKVEPLRGSDRLHLVMARPAEGLATGDVYGALTDEERGPSDRRAFGRMREDDRSTRAVVAALFNRLEGPAMRHSSAARRVAAEFKRASFLGRQLTGSGSCYFGICRHRRHAQRTTRLLGARCDGHVFEVSTFARTSARVPVELSAQRACEAQGEASCR
jgi:4-diphosphocytidyl-2-C-methyl-D-erythritol kinase